MIISMPIFTTGYCEMRFIGDIHGKFDDYVDLVGDTLQSIQVGDFGIGFDGFPGYIEPPILAPSHRFIRGNHDNPQKCREHPNYIGDLAVEGNTFYLSGAYSVDQYKRIRGADWWEDEQLSWQGLNQAISIYEQVLPEIVVTHDCPAKITNILFDYLYSKSDRTSDALQTMLDIHKPRLWVFGHFHTYRETNILGTTFVCVPNGHAIDIEL